MNPRKQNVLTLVRMFVDVSMVMIAWAVAWAVRFYAGLEVKGEMPSPVLYLKLLPFIGVIWLAVFAASGFYRRS